MIRSLSDQPYSEAGSPAPNIVIHHDFNLLRIAQGRRYPQGLFHSLLLLRPFRVAGFISVIRALILYGICYYLAELQSY